MSGICKQKKMSDDDEPTFQMQYTRVFMVTEETVNDDNDEEFRRLKARYRQAKTIRRMKKAPGRYESYLRKFWISSDTGKLFLPHDITEWMIGLVKKEYTMRYLSIHNEYLYDEGVMSETRYVRPPPDDQPLRWEYNHKEWVARHQQTPFDDDNWKTRRTYLITEYRTRESKRSIGLALRFLSLLYTIRGDDVATSDESVLRKYPKWYTESYSM